jgi:hypothetical protein
MWIVLQIQPRRPPLDPAQQQVLDGIERARSSNRTCPTRASGFPTGFTATPLVMDDVPYVNAAGVVQYGTLVSTLELNNDQTIRPTQHVMYFTGEHPCDRHGGELVRIKHSSQRQTLAEGIT